VFKAPCLNCPGVYIGETSQLLKKRMFQHMHKILKSKISVHALPFSVDHNFNFDSISILGREKNDRKRKILKMLLIIKNVHAVNFKTDTARASVVYRSVIANCEYSRVSNCSRSRTSSLIFFHYCTNTCFTLKKTTLFVET